MMMIDGDKQLFWNLQSKEDEHYNEDRDDDDGVFFYVLFDDVYAVKKKTKY